MSLRALVDHLDLLVDQRQRCSIRYPLVPLVLTALLAKLAGYARLSLWAQMRAAELSSLFSLARPTIQHQFTWGRASSRMPST